MRDAGIPVIVAYCDSEGWHMAAPRYDWTALAAGLRTLATECDGMACEGLPARLN
jgi:hypothetical protein